MIFFNDKKSPTSSKNKKLSTLFKPIITLECWDKDEVSSDDLLGTINLDLSEFVMGAAKEKFSFSEMKKNKAYLFEKKKCEGWWPFFDNGKKEKTITVSI
jgi:Ca2+-dependent lipid-binding protein